MPKDDDIPPIPSISASREGAAAGASVPRRRGNGRGSNRASATAGTAGGRPGAVWILLLLVALGVATAGCFWAWQLQERLTAAGHTMERYNTRIADLEDRLADTDEGMSQNAAVQAAKIRELDSEVRKLWDNVWKRSKERFGILEASSKRFEGAISANTQTIEATQGDLGAAKQDLAKLQSVAGDLERLMSSAQRSQAEVERVADTLNAINLELAKLNRRVSGNEEWITAINAFRQTTNATISQLQAALRDLQQQPAGS